MHKILLYTDTPIAGGAEKHMQLLAKYLQKKGHIVQLACSNYKSLDAWCQNLKNDKITVFRLKVSHKHDPRHFFQLKKIIQNEKPDILHLHLWNPGACRYAFGIKTPSFKIITTEHDPFALKGLKKILKKRAIAKTFKTIAVSEANATQMLQWYPELKGKISVIHNGIDIENFEKELLHFCTQEKAKIRKEVFKISPTYLNPPHQGAKINDFIILSIAALHPRKGLEYLIKAFAKVHSQKPQTKLVIVGEGPQKTTLQKLIHKLKLDDYANIIGHQEDIPKILKKQRSFCAAKHKRSFRTGFVGGTSRQNSDNRI